VIRYLTGATGLYLEGGLSFERDIGLMIQPGNNYHGRVQHYPVWAADNGAFSSRRSFDAAKFRAMLAQGNLDFWRDTCLFVAAPDVVGDARATLRRFPEWAREIRDLGFPVALVAQDNLECVLEDVPWDLVDVLFVGGSTEWKINIGAEICVDYARALGKRTHMGRVNSCKRLTLANSWGVDSADGTFLAFGPRKNLPRLLRWFTKCQKSPWSC
jgi:hypothetical protein